ncbi:MAG: alpha/beta fold hydrolase [Pseudomonadales bacterium]|nr:alpha/beta hydrolase [Pseudomonadales bacterium]NIX09137.1 alpha/beta fold hydrolase [Pseudomonadales bacterium]
MSASPIRRRWQVTDAFGDGNIDIAGLDWGGSGPLALLQHANGFCAATWGPVAAGLTERYHVVALDARGHGDSGKRPIPGGYRWNFFASDLTQVAQQLLDETGEPAIDFGIGSSMGGIVTAASEARNPGLFRRIAMLDPPLHPGPELRERLGLGIATPNADLIAMTKKRKAIWPSRSVARQAWRDKPLFRDWVGAAFDAYLEEGLGDRPDGKVALKCDPGVEASIFETTGSLDTFELAPGVNAPVLLVRALHGRAPAIAFEHLASLLPRCSYRVVDAGHLLPMESPDLTLELLTAFAGEG